MESEFSGKRGGRALRFAVSTALLLAPAAGLGACGGEEEGGDRVYVNEPAPPEPPVARPNDPGPEAEAPPPEEAPAEDPPPLLPGEMAEEGARGEAQRPRLTAEQLNELLDSQ